MKITMPRITTNDDFVTLGCWCVSCGDFVRKGQTLAVLETTKETRDLVAEEDGYISYEIQDGTEVEVGDVVAELAGEPAEAAKSSAVPEKTDHISKKALELMKKHHISAAELPTDRIRLPGLNSRSGFFSIGSNAMDVICP